MGNKGDSSFLFRSCERDNGLNVTFLSFFPSSLQWMLHKKEIHIFQGIILINKRRELFLHPVSLFSHLLLHRQPVQPQLDKWNRKTTTSLCPIAHSQLFFTTEKKFPPHPSHFLYRDKGWEVREWNDVSLRKGPKIFQPVSKWCKCMNRPSWVQRWMNEWDSSSSYFSRLVNDLVSKVRKIDF